MKKTFLQPFTSTHRNRPRVYRRESRTGSRHHGTVEEAEVQRIRLTVKGVV